MGAKPEKQRRHRGIFTGTDNTGRHLYTSGQDPRRSREFQVGCLALLKWLRSYFLMLKWVFLNNRTWLSLNLAVQIGIAFGFVYGMSFFYPATTPDIAKYLTTGAPTIILLTVGLVMGPQIIAMMRQEGTFDYIWSLPVPRMAHVAADATNMFGSTLPGIALAVVLGAMHFDFALNISPLIVPE